MTDTQAKTTDFCWLIERSQPEGIYPPEYWVKWRVWTTDATKATRFYDGEPDGCPPELQGRARAQDIANGLHPLPPGMRDKPYCRVVEHGFMSRPADSALTSDPTDAALALEALEDLVCEATSQPPVELEVVRKAEATIRAFLSRSGPADEIAWLIERHGDGLMCACSHGENWHTGGGSLTFTRTRCGHPDCECINYQSVGAPRWWNGKGWTQDHAAALRFARKVDAERVMALNDWTNSWVGIHASEHIWTDAGRSAAVLQRAPVPPEIRDVKCFDFEGQRYHQFEQGQVVCECGDKQRPLPPPSKGDAGAPDTKTREHITDGSPCWCDPVRISFADAGTPTIDALGAELDLLLRDEDLDDDKLREASENLLPRLADAICCRLRTDAEYREALARVEVLVKADPAADTKDGHELTTLSLKVRDYEAVHFPLSGAAPLREEATPLVHDGALPDEHPCFRCGFPRYEHEVGGPTQMGCVKFIATKEEFDASQAPLAWVKAANGVEVVRVAPDGTVTIHDNATREQVAWALDNIAHQLAARSEAGPKRFQATSDLPAVAPVSQPETTRLTERITEYLTDPTKLTLAEQEVAVDAFDEHNRADRNSMGAVFAAAEAVLAHRASQHSEAPPTLMTREDFAVKADGGNMTDLLAFYDDATMRIAELSRDASTRVAPLMVQADLEHPSEHRDTGGESVGASRATPATGEPISEAVRATMKQAAAELRYAADHYPKSVALIHTAIRVAGSLEYQLEHAAGWQSIGRRTSGSGPSACANAGIGPTHEPTKSVEQSAVV